MEKVLSNCVCVCVCITHTIHAHIITINNYRNIFLLKCFVKSDTTVWIFALVVQHVSTFSCIETSCICMILCWGVFYVFVRHGCIPKYEYSLTRDKSFLSHACSVLAGWWCVWNRPCHCNEAYFLNLYKSLRVQPCFC